jgi:hypothetical protein
VHVLRIPGRSDAELCNDCAIAVNVMEARMFVWLGSFVAVLCALLWSPAVHACKCAPEPPAREARDSAAAVFEGRVTQITELASGDVVVALSVARTWKNAGVEQILVRTHGAAAACGFNFERDLSYLVYAEEAQADASLPGLTVSRCGRTRLATKAAADFAELGLGAIPVSPTVQDTADDQAARMHGRGGPLATQHDQPAAGGCASCSISGRGTPDGSALLLGVGLLWLRWRKRRLGVSARTRPLRG